MKAYTDLNQSKKLSEILPLESADFMWEYNPDKETYWDKPTMIPIDSYIFVNDIPCWSLAALLEIIKKTIGYTLQTTYDKNPKVYIVCELGDKPYSMESSEYDNEVDACYEMIIKLHEQKLL